MAPEKKENKWKAVQSTSTSAPVPPAKKSKKLDNTSSRPTDKGTKSILKKKESTTIDVAAATPSATVNGNTKRTLRPRKRAVDFLSDDEEEKETVSPTDDAVKELEESTHKRESGKVHETKSTSVNKKSKEASKPPAEEVAVTEVADTAVADTEVDHADEDDGNDDYGDDQTAELLKGFESSGDEDASGDEGFDPDAPIPRVPDSKKAKRRIVNRRKKVDEPQQPGTIYVGRIPHGFYEHQMRAYFSQFGDITRLRLSRNRTTGRSKHYAFLEFASTTVARIVAETMDNYLLYGHILKCKYLPQDQVHPELWKGSNRRYKVIPWNTVERNRLAGGKTREKWEKKVEQEEQRRLKKAEKMKALGYEFDLPKIKTPGVVPLQSET